MSIKYNLIALFSLIFLIIISCADANEPTQIDPQLPEACFNLNITTNNKVGDNVQFTNCSKNATHFAWKFGDGNSSTQREPVHTFQMQGSYDVELLAGEDKNKDGVLDILDDPDVMEKSIEISPNHLAAELTILSVDGWTPENTQPSAVPGATILLYKEYPSSFDLGEPDYTFLSSENGKVFFYDNDVVAECFVVKKGDQSNIVNHYLVGGVFQSQEEVDYSLQDGAVVGGVKYVDLNGDGLINESDQTPCQSISITSDETFEIDVFIGN